MARAHVKAIGFRGRSSTVRSHGVRVSPRHGMATYGTNAVDAIARRPFRLSAAARSGLICRGGGPAGRVPAPPAERTPGCTRAAAAPMVGSAYHPCGRHATQRAAAATAAVRRLSVRAGPTIWQVRESTEPSTKISTLLGVLCPPTIMPAPNRHRCRQKIPAVLMPRSDREAWI